MDIFYRLLALFKIGCREVDVHNNLRQVRGAGSLQLRLWGSCAWDGGSRRRDAGEPASRSWEERAAELVVVACICGPALWDTGCEPIDSLRPAWATARYFKKMCGQYGVLAGSGACRQAWQPELENSLPHVAPPPSTIAPWHTHTHTCTR